jgi:ankyrin repeat protein
MNDLIHDINRNSLNTIKHFIQNGQINSNNYKEVIHYAAHFNKPIILELLIKEFGIYDDPTLLIKNPYMTQMLIHYGINVNAEDYFGNNALAFIPKNYNLNPNKYNAIAKILLEAGTDPLKLNRLGKTPLDLARESGIKDLVELMITYIANLVPPKKAWAAFGKYRYKNIYY